MPSKQPHECDYPYPHDPASCANFRLVSEEVDRKHPFRDENGVESYPPGSGDEAIKFLRRYLP